MTKTEKNKIIVGKIRVEIAQRGLSGKLDVFPVVNTFTRRPRYWNDGEINLFKIHMWDINELDEDSLQDEIASRLDHAQRYFGI